LAVLAALPAAAAQEEIDPTNLRIQEMTVTELLGGLSSENVLVLTSLAQFRELMRFVVVNNAVSP
jgi:hypothetical protein